MVRRPHYECLDNQWINDNCDVNISGDDFNGNFDDSTLILLSSYLARNNYGFVPIAVLILIQQFGCRTIPSKILSYVEDQYAIQCITDLINGNQFDVRLIYRSSETDRNFQSLYKSYRKNSKDNYIMFIKTNFGHVFAVLKYDFGDGDHLSSVFLIRSSSDIDIETKKRIRFTHTAPHIECITIGYISNPIDTIVMLGNGDSLFSHCRFNVFCGGNNKWNNKYYHYYIFKCIKFEMYSIKLRSGIKCG
eukprot:98130_1